MSSELSACFVFNQEKYKRDQEKLQAEWLKAQLEITKNTLQKEVKKKNHGLRIHIDIAVVMYFLFRNLSC